MFKRKKFHEIKKSDHRHKFKRDRSQKPPWNEIDYHCVFCNKPVIVVGRRE